MINRIPSAQNFDVLTPAQFEQEFAGFNPGMAIPEASAMSNGSSSSTSKGGEGPNSVWSLIAQIKAELASHQFNAANAPAIADIQAQLAEAQAGAQRAYNSHLALATKVRAHDTRSLDSKSRGGGGGGGLGGGGLAGPGSLGGFPSLGKVPVGATNAGASSSTGPSPMAIVLVLAVAGVGGYLLYHKLRMAHAQEKTLDKGDTPKNDDS